MLQTIADTGSFAAAARASHMVPSALTYRVRQIEDALDVLLFDRSSRQARLTEAGDELLREGARLLADIDAVANRVKRVATGWEPQLTIAVDSIINPATVMELCDGLFCPESADPACGCAPKPCPAPWRTHVRPGRPGARRGRRRQAVSSACSASRWAGYASSLRWRRTTRWPMRRTAAATS